MLFLLYKRVEALFALSSLMPRAREQLAVLMLPHFFSSLFDYATQQITSILVYFKLVLFNRYKTILLSFFLDLCPHFFRICECRKAAAERPVRRRSGPGGKAAGKGPMDGAGRRGPGDLRASGW